MIDGILWARLLGRLHDQAPVARPAPAVRQPSQAACPHCTNLDTLTLHCPDDRCGWASCTCGALLYTARRHRHPRHRSGRDTCHDPAGAV